MDANSTNKRRRPFPHAVACPDKTGTEVKKGCQHSHCDSAKIKKKNIKTLQRPASSMIKVNFFGLEKEKRKATSFL